MAKIQQKSFFYPFAAAMLLYVGLTSYFYIYQLSAKSRLIYMDNYRSLLYGVNILRELPLVHQSDTSIQYISQQINLQKQNLTEVGEKPLTDSLSYFFSQLIQTPSPAEEDLYQQKAKRTLFKIIDLNSAAIEEKIKFSRDYNQVALIWVGFQLLLGGIIGLIFWLIYQKIKHNNQNEELKNNFLSTVSHELKTPISTIKLSIQLLENHKIGLLNPQQAELLAQIEQDSDRLLKITNELLNLSQLEAGKIPLNLQPTDLSGIVSYAIRTVQLQLQPKNLDIRVDVDPNLPLVSIDGEKTSWVLLNLLNNAIRYSEDQGQIMVKSSQKQHWLELSVRDFGQGIAAAHQDKVFERYFQAPNQKGSAGAAGVGLAISKEFMEAQGGKISLRSELGQGAEFILSFPI